MQGLGFAVEMLGVGAALIGSMPYGRAALRGHVPAWAAWPLVLAAPAAVPTGVLTGYIPHRAVLPLSVATGVLGCHLLTRRREEHGQTGSERGLWP